MFPRLYAILDLDLVRSLGLEPLALLDLWLEAGVRLVQLRAKGAAGSVFLDLATRMSRATASAGATFIVNDRPEIAQMSGADGVHLGQGDLPAADARSVLGPGAIIGVSTHNEVQANAAVASPVSYLAIGPVFATASKVKPDPVVGLNGVRGVAAIARTRELPVVAIGGITLERAAEVCAAGAASVAVISDLLTGDPGARVRAFLRALV